MENQINSGRELPWKADPVGRFMTPDPYCVDAHAKLGEAYPLMHDHNVRHLPVLRDGALVGLVSQRDLFRFECAVFVDRIHDPVSDAMTETPYTVTPEEPLVYVAAQMLKKKKKKLGSAVVVKNGKVVGIVTTVDALAALVVRRSSRAMCVSCDCFASGWITARTR